MTDAAPIRPRILAIIVGLVALVAFIPALFGNWIYDDWPLIAQNPYAHSLAHWPRYFTHDFWDLNPESHLASHLSYWRPLINASYGVDWTIGSGSPVMFHVTNAIAHALVAVMVFVTLRRWVGKAVPAALAAALFAAMPAKAANVAWIAGRTDIACALFMLVALLGMGRRLSGQRGGLALEILGTAGAYLTKEQAVVLPAFVLVELWVAWNRPAIDLAFVKRCIRPTLPQAAFAVAYLAARALFMPIRDFKVAPRPLVDHGLALLDSLGRFIAELVVPIDATTKTALINAGGHDAPYVALGLATALGGVAIAWLVRRSRPAVTLALVVFFVAMAPTVEMVSQRYTPVLTERFLYIASIAVALLLADLLAKALPGRARLGAIVLGVVTAGSLALAMHRSSFYVDDHTFAAHEVELHPENYDVRRMRVDTVLRESKSRRALEYMLDTLRVAPPMFKVETAYAVADLATQTVSDLDDASLHAIDAFLDQLISRAPHAELHIAAVDVSIDLPNYISDASVTARMNALRANIASRLGDTPRALEEIQKSLDRCDKCDVFISMKALVLARSGRLDDALATLGDPEAGTRDPRIATMRAHIIKAGTSFNKARSLSGPQALQANHEALVALGEWGKAYKLLLPYREQMLASGPLAEMFAGTAYRAGRVDEARSALGRHHSTEEIDALLAAWAEDMGWSP